MVKGGRSPSPDDYSYIWRRRIEKPDYATEDVKEILIGSLVWLCKTRISEKSLNLENCLKILSEYDWYVFDRIALYLLREYGDEDSIEVISQKLRDDNLYDEKNVFHEYYELLKKFFINLDSQMKNFIIKRILDKSFDYLRIEYGYSEDNVKEEKEIWQRDKLEPISNYLPENEKQYYHALIEKYGETEYPGFSSEIPQVKMGPNSPIKLEDLKSKSVEEIIQYLNEWKPIQNDMFDPSIEGLGRVLEDVIISDPNKYILKLDLFETIKEPTYFRSLLSAFRNLTNNNKTIEWGKVISFCTWLLDHEADFPDLKLMGDEKFSRDSGLKHTKHTMASLFYSALSSAYENEKELYPYQIEIWKILEILAEDEDPTLDREKEDCESKNYDSLAINSIRGEALHAVVRYALWRYRKEQNENKSKEELENFFTDFVPEVKNILEKHLDKNKDPLISIHTIYGQWLPWLVWVDKKWVEDHLNNIFPKDESNLEYRKAAWRAYIYLCDPYNDIYKIIKPEYNYWISRLNKKDFDDDSNKQLAQHLMTFYWRNRLELKELDEFFNIAPQEVREEALTFIGLSLTRKDEQIADIVMKKFVELWEHRFKKISQNYKLNEHLGELSTFVWWVRSGKLDLEWGMKQLKSVLELVGFPDDISVLFRTLRDLSEKLKGDETWVSDMLDCLVAIVSSKKWVDQSEYWNFDIKEIVRQIKLKFKTDQIKEKVEQIKENMMRTGYFPIKDV